MSPRAACRLEGLGFTDVAHYLGGIADWAAAGLPIEGRLADEANAGAVARRDVPTCALTDRLGDIKARLAGTGWNTCFVLDGDRIVMGRLYQRDLDGPPERTAEAAMHLGPSTFRPNVPAHELLHTMIENDLRTAPITTSDGTLVGLALRSDLEELGVAEPSGKPAEA